MSDHPAVIHIDGPLTADNAKRIEAQLNEWLNPAPRWFVLVKGHHDSGTIDGVFGPYTEKLCDWLLGNVLDCSSYNWTKVRLQDGPGETAQQRADRLA